MTSNAKTGATLAIVCGAFSALALAFLSDGGGSHWSGPGIALVDTNFLDVSTTRKSYADLAREGADLSDYDCYVCHDKKKPPPLRLDTNGNIMVATEHADIVMGHGRHGRNNNCFNCHNETNLLLFQTKDGRELKFADSPELCGSCHGPTYRDWLAGAHGRISGYWDRGSSPFTADEIKDLPGMVNRWRRQADPVSAFVWQNLSNQEQALLADYRPPAPSPGQVQGAVLHALNKIIGEPSLYKPERFKGVTLAMATASLLQQSPRGDNMIYLNRLLLEDAFPVELARSQRKACVNCHNPHSPPFPSRKPAPGPHPLREMSAATSPQSGHE